MLIHFGNTRTFCQRKTSGVPFDNEHTWTSDHLLCQFQCFSLRPMKERWKRLRAKYIVQFLQCSSVILAS